MITYTAGLKTDTTVITLAEAKANLRITHTYQDDLVQGLVDAAVEDIENYTGRSVHRKVWTLTTSCFEQYMQLRFSPVASALVIRYVDTDGNTQTLDSALYQVGTNSYGEPVVVYSDFSSLPEVSDSTTAVTMEYTAGYTTDDVPQAFKVYVKLLVNKLYENPADTPLRYRSYAKSFIYGYKKHVSDVY